MNKEKLVPILKGAIQHIPGVKTILPKRTGGTIDSRYCYSVWMRHLKHLAKSERRMPKIVAELGPGDSLGIGLCALLSGCSRLYALDVVKYWDGQRNSRIFDELIELFKCQANIPDNSEYPKVHPEIADHAFPSEMISAEQLAEALAKDRLDSIRNELSNLGDPDNSFITVHIPWDDARVIERHSVDFIYSQAVLEHVEDLDNAYIAMSEWLKPKGLMSHTIDFKSHGITRSWNGHWTFSDLEWEIVKGGKAFLINRRPFTSQIEAHAKYGFEILEKSLIKSINGFSREQFSDRFKALTDDEMTTSGMYVLSKKT